MICELKKYAEGMNCKDDVIKWIDTHLAPKISEVTQTEAEHILDYMASEERPKRISRMSLDQAKKNMYGCWKFFLKAIW